MSAVSPGSRLASKEPSRLCVRPLDDPATKQAVEALLHIFQSSFGPNGRVHLVHNDTGGHVTCTSSSARLLQTMSVSMPVLRLVTAAVEGHLRLFSDCGGFAALFALKLIHRFIGQNVFHKRLIVEVQELLLGVSVDHLQSECCACKTGVDFSNLSKTMGLVKNILVSKPGCLVFGKDLAHVCQLVLDGFLRTSNKTNAEHQQILYKTVEGQPVNESSMWNGILFESPQIPTYRSSPLTLVKTLHGNTECIKVILVKISMAGDSEEFLDVNYESTLSSAAFTETVVDQMMKFAEDLVSQGDVGILACQKVIHPRLKKHLKQQNILVLDRLGLVTFTALSKMTGGTDVTSFHKAVSDDYCGYLQSVTHVVLHGRSYIHLEPLAACVSLVCTMVLCHHSEQALDELKVTCEVGHHMLQLYSRDPVALMGGGCWQTLLAHHINNQVQTQAKAWAEELGCTKLQVIEIATVFSRCLEEIVQNLDRDRLSYHVTDLTNHHHFILPHDQPETCDWMKCQCGAVNYDTMDSFEYRYLSTDKDDSLIQPLNVPERTYTFSREKCEVLDNFLPSRNALRTAVNVANMVLGIHTSIIDPN